jgi:hypothetical protein
MGTLRWVAVGEQDDGACSATAREQQQVSGAAGPVLPRSMLRQNDNCLSARSSPPATVWRRLACSSVDGARDVTHSVRASLFNGPCALLGSALSAIEQRAAVSRHRSLDCDPCWHSPALLYKRGPKRIQAQQDMFFPALLYVRSRSSTAHDTSKINFCVRCRRPRQSQLLGAPS